MLPRYIDLIRDFLENSISASEFEASYLQMFKSDNQLHREEEFQALDGLFAAVDSFVGDAPIVDARFEIDESQLREAARVALDTLLSLRATNNGS